MNKCGFNKFVVSGVACVLSTIALTTGPAEAVPIVYEGVLTPDVTQVGQVGPRTSGDFPGVREADFIEADFWSFSGNTGDLITLTVNRREANFDPYFLLFAGLFSDTADIFGTARLASADDEILEPPGLAGPFEDPQLAAFVLPVTGDFTVVVGDGLAADPGSDGVYDYQITLELRPSAPVTVSEPGSLALICLGLAGLGLAKRRRRKAA